MSRYYYAPTTIRVVGTCAISCPSCHEIDTDAPATVEQPVIGVYDRLAGTDDAIAFAHSRYYAETIVGLLQARDSRVSTGERV